jgi:RNA polymerase sigma-70 factor (ECF subfamily)
VVSLSLSVFGSLARVRLCGAETPWYGRQDVNRAADESRREGDRELVSAMARGDRRALATLYDLHAPLLVGLVRRILGSREEAEDVVHDVFLEAWRRAADYDETRGSVRTWLVLRARSRALDRKKSAAVSKTVTTAESRWLDGLGGQDDNSASEAPDCALVRRVLLSLPEDQRTVLLLGYFEGLSSSEIAERIRVPIGTVKSRVAAALARLRAAVGQEPEESR